MKNRLPIYSRTVLFTALAGLSAHSAVANVLLEEVIVTAQKRESALIDTPIAITAISSDQLKALGITTQQDIANFTPSMSYQEAAGGAEGNRIYLRGIGRETNTTGTEPGVGIYNNGFYSNEAGSLVGSTDRIERIEVLRGPQGTLFGRNTTGGAINVVSKTPGEEYEHVARFNAGNYGAKAVELTSSGPVTDKVGYLLHYAKTEQDSFFENVSGSDPIGTDADYIEGQLDVDFTESINWNLRYYSGAFENEALEFVKIDGYRNEPGAPSKLGTIVVNPEAFALLAQAPGQSDPFKLSSDFQGSVEVNDAKAFQSTLTFELDGFNIKMLNGYTDQSWYSEKDFDGTASPVSFVEKIGQAEKTQQHEIQFISNGDGDIDWLVGLFYFEIELGQPYTLADAGNPFLTSLDGNSSGIFYTQTGQLDANSMAVYGQLNWQATDKLNLSIGLRYSEDEKEGYESQDIFYDSVLDFCDEATFAGLVAANDPYGTPAGCARFGLYSADDSGTDTHKENWDAVDWRVNASYDLNDDSMLYATISSGSKPGGFRLGGLQNDITTVVNESVVDNEELIAYEIGYKTTVGDSLSISTAAYFYDYSDMQVELAFLNPNSGLVSSKLANASSVDIYGFEVESTWAATEKLTVLANYSYINSEYTDDFFVSDNKTNIVRNVKGNELNRAPNNKFTLAGYYVQPVGDGDLVFTANYSYIDDQYMTVFNDDIETVESYEQLNARISWQPASEKYEVSIYGANLTDELSFANDYGVTGLDDGVRRNGRPINPRTYGMELALFF